MYWWVCILKHACRDNSILKGAYITFTKPPWRHHNKAKQITHLAHCHFFSNNLSASNSSRHVLQQEQNNIRGGGSGCFFFSAFVTAEQIKWHVLPAASWLVWLIRDTEHQSFTLTEWMMHNTHCTDTRDDSPSLKGHLLKSSGDQTCIQVRRSGVFVSFCCKQTLIYVHPRLYTSLWNWTVVVSVTRAH